MSTAEKFFHLSELVTDRLNPILVKETRQALKSRQFIITFMMLLTVSCLICFGGVIFFGPSLEYGSSGRVFFTYFLYVLGFSTLFVVPFGAYRSMLNEQDHNTYELLSISTLTPRQIVSGKLRSAFVQILIYYSAIIPFISFTALLQGFDFAMVALSLSIGIVWATSVSMVSIMLSTLSNQKQWQAMNTLGVIVLLFLQFIPAVILITAAQFEAIPYDDEEFWWFLACMTLGAGSYFLLSQQIAVSRLTFESDNRSSGIRAICTLQFWLLWTVLYVYGVSYGASMIDDEVIVVFSVFSSIHWFVAGLIFSTESDYLSRRIRRGLPRFWIVRLCIAPWMPGGGRGLVLLIIHLLALMVIGRMAIWPDWVHSTVTAIALYTFCYVAFGAATGRWAHSITPEFRSAHARVLAVLMAALATIAPYLPPALGFTELRMDYSISEISNPIRTLNVLSTHPGLRTITGAPSSTIYTELSNEILLTLSGVAIFALLLNARAMVTGIIEIVRCAPASVGRRAESVIAESHARA